AGAAARGGMKVRAGSGWQTVLADLSLILFMVTASVVNAQYRKAQAHPPARARSEAPARAEPVAVYRPGPGAPPLRVWLKEQGADPRQLLTIVIPYARGGEAAALERARELAAGAPNPPRIIVEPGPP